jgi:hypothetical protein
MCLAIKPSFSSAEASVRVCRRERRSLVRPLSAWFALRQSYTSKTMDLSVDAEIS